MSCVYKIESRTTSKKGCLTPPQHAHLLEWVDEMKKAPISSGKKRWLGRECEPVLSHCSYEIKLRHTRNEGKGRKPKLAKDKKALSLDKTWLSHGLGATLGFRLSEGTTCCPRSSGAPVHAHSMPPGSTVKLISTSDLQKSSLPKGIQEAIYFDKISKKLLSL